MLSKVEIASRILALPPDQQQAAMQAFEELYASDGDYIPQKPTDRQQLFLDLKDEREVFYGRAAGGGKSSCLLMAALEYVETPGYSALLLRRTYADLAKPGALMDRAHQWLQGKGAKWNEQKKQWTFPSGAVLTFGYLENENDKYQYQGAEYQFCVERGTPVLMGDGTYKPINEIEAGDEVATLQGRRKVRRVMRVGVKPCVRLSTEHGTHVVVSESHPVLTDGGWVSPLSLKPIRYRDGGSIGAGSARQPLASDTRPAYLLPGLSPTGGFAPRTPVHSLPPETYASSVDTRNDYARFGGSRLADSLPPMWSARAMLFSRALPRASADTSGVCRLRAPSRAQSGCEVQDSQSGCRDASCSCGGQSRPALASDLIRIPSPTDAEGTRPSCLSSGGRENTHGRNRSVRCTYSHPYTKERLESVESVLPSRVDISQAGEREVWDLTVEEASHYVTYGGIISQNCGFDELTQFKESAYTYLFSRLRRLSTSDIPIRMRAASNPGGVGAQWVYERFVPDDFSPEQAREQKVFWKEGEAEDGRQTRRAFVPATLDDNPFLDREEYAHSLQELDPVERERLLRGDWSIKERGDILSMWDENYHVISWKEFAAVFGTPYIPLTWLLGVYQDWGTTPEHPCVTSWFATAPENAPTVRGVRMAGSVFLYRGYVTSDATVREVATEINRLMGPHGEKSRVRRWRMSHEAASERIAYSREHDLPFQAWKTGKTRGIAQLRNAMELVETDLQHPFRPWLKGHPKVYHVVSDEELSYPKTDAGLVRHRAEAPAYHWATLKSGEAMNQLVPYALFNDAMDTERAAAADYWPNQKPKSKQERREERLKPEVRLVAIVNEENPDLQQAKIQTRDLQLKRMKAEEDRQAERGRKMIVPRFKFKR